MSQTSITIELDSAVQSRLAALADARSQPLSDIAAEVLTLFVAPESWEHKHIQAGITELDSGQSVSDEKVTEWLDSWGTEHELPAPR